MKSKAAIFLVAAVCLSIQTRTDAAVYSDPAVGYSLKLPDDWAAIPQSALEDFQKRLMPGADAAASFKYVAAFQPASHANYFEYPYLIVQVTSRGDGRVVDSISEYELKQFAATISGMKGSDIKKGLNPEAGQLLGNVGLTNQVTYFTAPPGIQWVLSARTQAGNFHAVVYCLVGKHHLISANLSTREEDWSNSLPVFQKVIAGFHLTPDEQVTLSQNASEHQMAVNAAITGAIVGTFAALLLRKKRRKPPASA